MYSIKDKKRISAEELYGMLDVDGYFVHEAFLTDDAEGLAELKREEKRRRCECAKRRLLHKAVACFVCLAVVVGVFLFGYIYDNRVPSVQTWTDFEPIEGEVKIDGIDPLLYYSARHILGAGRKTEMRVANSTPLSYNEKKSDECGDNMEPKGDIVYYEFDPSWDYTVTKVIYFKAELKGENGFIADKLGGIGEVDVIITESSISDIITFGRNGKYYSCHVNSYLSEGGKDEMTFSTHIYTDGFRIIKNTAQDNYSFKVVIKNGKVIELDCDYLECADGEWDREADRIGIINGSSITVKTNVTLNITELESFFNSVVNRDIISDNGSDRRRRGM